MRSSPVWMCLVALLFLPACGNDATTVPQEPTVDPNLELQQGWALFRTRDFPAAAVHFERVIEQTPAAPEGYVGVGWCEIETDSLPSAFSTLDLAVRLGDKTDGVAGLAVAASALGRDSIAVEAAARITNEAYIFAGDPTFGYPDLVYIRALGLFHLLRYEECLETMKILRPDLQIDLEAFDFREQLFEALESLGGSA